MRYKTMNIDWPLFLSAVALAAVLESVPYILAPDRMRKVLGELAKTGDVGLRRYGLMTLGFGLVLLYIVRRFAV